MKAAGRRGRFSDKCEGAKGEGGNAYTGVYEVVVFIFRDGTGLRLLEFLVFDFFELDHGGFG